MVNTSETKQRTLSVLAQVVITYQQLASTLFGNNTIHMQTFAWDCYITMHLGL